MKSSKYGSPPAGLATAAFVAMYAMVAHGQGTLSLAVSAGPPSFATSGPCAPPIAPCLGELVKTEPLTLTLTATPSAPIGPGPYPVRRLAVWLGLPDQLGAPFCGYAPGGSCAALVHITPLGIGPGGATITAAPVLDSFFDPNGPVFGPGLSAPENTTTISITLSLPDPPFALGPLPLVLQAFVEDVPGANPALVLSGPVGATFVDPEFAHAPALTAIDPPGAALVSPLAGRIFTQWSGPLGELRSEGSTAGADVLVIDGANFLAQTDSTQFPPTVAWSPVGGGPVALSTTNVTTASAARLVITTPPATGVPPGFYFVSATNAASISPAATAHAAAEPYLFRGGVPPQISALSIVGRSGAPIASPFGGQTLTILGSGFAAGSAVRITALSGGVATGGLAPWRSCPAAAAIAPGAISVVLPPLATGEARVEVISPDEYVASTSFPGTPHLVVGAATPVVVATGPSFSSPFLSGATPPFAVMAQGQAAVALTATNAFGAGDPLFAATSASTLPGAPIPGLTTACAGSSGPTVRGDLLQSTTFELLLADGVTWVPLTTGALAPGSASAQPLVADVGASDIGTLRPQMGVRQIRARNASILGSASAPATGPSATVLIQSARAPAPVSIVPSAAPASIDDCLCRNATDCGPSTSGIELDVASWITIQGSDFFGVAPDPVAVNAASGAPTLESLRLPVVRFVHVASGAAYYGRRTRFDAAGNLEVEVPAVATNVVIPIGPYDVTTINPDGRSATLFGAFRITPRLTDACAGYFNAKGLPELNLNAELLGRAANLLNLDFVANADACSPAPCVGGNIRNPQFQIAAIRNPTAFLDASDELAQGTVPPQILATYLASPAAGLRAYDLCFLLNTRKLVTPGSDTIGTVPVPASAGMPAPTPAANVEGTMRFYDFASIDLPPTIDLPSPVAVIGVDGTLDTLPAGTYRTIVKAAAFDFDIAATLRFRWYSEANFPLALRSKGPLRIDALIDLGGDALVEEVGLVSGSALSYRARHDWVPAPAGAGVGGRGGSYYCSQPGVGVPGAGLALPPAIAVGLLTSGTPGCLAPSPFPTPMPFVKEQWGLDGYASILSRPAIALPPIVSLPTGALALGFAASDMNGSPGFPPQFRADATPGAGGTPIPGAVNPYGGAPISGGRGGDGSAPIGGAGGGAGGGMAVAGSPGGFAASGIAAVGGFRQGNATDYGIAAVNGPPPNDDFVYGRSATAGVGDFLGPLSFGFEPTAPPSSQFPVAMFSGGSGGGGGGGSISIFVPCVSIGGRGGNGGGSIILLADGPLTLGPYGRLIARGEDGRGALDAFPIPNVDPLLFFCSPGNGGGGSGGLVYALSATDIVFEPPPPGTNPVRVDVSGGLGGTISNAVSTPTTTGGAGAYGRARFAVNEFSGRAEALRAAATALATAAQIVPAGATAPFATQCVGASPSAPCALFLYPSL